MNKKTILITGGGGYVGSVLIPKLIQDGYYIKCLDRFFFGKTFLSSSKFENKLELIENDIRWVDSEVFQDVDTVLDLAALSNDPVGDLDPQKTFEINHFGRKRIANLSKKEGVPQYILASSASVYGQQSKIADENSEVLPLTAYSKANRSAETSNLPLNDKDFSVTVLRFSSLYGVSPRMRFDISVNSMVLDLFQKNKIIVHGKNNQRPFLHINDAVEAYRIVLNTKKEKIAGEIFNVGTNEQNYKIGDIAKEIIEELGNNTELELGDNNDHRSYEISFDKIHKRLSFNSKYNIKNGVKEIHDALQTKEITDSMETITLKWYQHIQENKELREKFSIKGKIF